MIFIHFFSGTSTSEALKFVTEEVFGSGDKFSGDRAGNRNLVVFLTDGLSFGNTTEVSVFTQAPLLRDVAHTVSVYFKG